MFLDIHALHTLPYSNVNRDGLGSPKTAIYGGVPRIRVSSQSWKREARLVVEQQIGSATVRTRNIATAVRKQLVEQGWDEGDARRAGRAIVHAYGLAPDDDTDGTSVLLWLPKTVVDDLAQLASEHRGLVVTVPLPEVDNKGKPKKLSKEQKADQEKRIKETVATLAEPVTSVLNRRSPTIALLGRMLADTPDHTVDGATQVAHAITVHEAAADFDYFTAVDDLPLNSGAGHLATAEFASGTFYRYCTVNISQLVKQLGDKDVALSVVEAWCRAFITVVPSGKKNSTAPATVPDLVHLAVRNAPLSLVAAYETPLTTQGGYTTPARNELDKYAQRLHRFLGAPNRWAGYATTGTDTLEALGDPYEALDDLVQAATNTILDHVAPEAAA